MDQIMCSQSVVLEVGHFFSPAINFCLLKDIPTKVSSFTVFTFRTIQALVISNPLLVFKELKFIIFAHIWL